MCGLAGVVGLSIDFNILKKMNEKLFHRGPDDVGYFQDKNVNLAFSRLSIVDIKNGHQPMCNEANSMWTLFNGEIYNHIELRNCLKKNHRFNTDHSDTEVIVHGFEEYNNNLFKKLNGMFAIAIWDNKYQKLTLARDRYGIKPLYYSLLPNGSIIFASEIKAILASGFVEKLPNYNGILEYFSFQNLWESQTMFNNIYQLEPGTILTWQNGYFDIEQYWDITFPRSNKGKVKDLVMQHNHILQNAIKRHLQADVPVSTYLSGGIDSSAITAIAYKNNKKLKAYSCIFDLKNVGEDKICDERHYSSLLASTYGLERIVLEVGDDDLKRCLYPYVYALEDLRMGMGYVNYLIAKFVSKDAKVVLSGTGGDEFHGGYIGRYLALGLTKNKSLIGKFKNLFPNFIKKVNNGNLHKYGKILNGIIPKDQFNNVFTNSFLNKTNFDPDVAINFFLNKCPSSNWFDKVMYVDAKTYLVGLLTFEDKISMAHSLETRVPLLDNELVDFVLDLPIQVLCKNDVGKIIFRESIKEMVPDDIYKKPKMGFGPPDASWYRGRLKSWIESHLNNKWLNNQNILKPKFVQQTLIDHFTGKSNNTYLIWSFLNFKVWCDTFDFTF